MRAPDRSPKSDAFAEGANTVVVLSIPKFRFRGLVTVRCIVHSRGDEMDVVDVYCGERVRAALQNAQFDSPRARSPSISHRQIAPVVLLSIRDAFCRRINRVKTPALANTKAE